MTKPMTKPTTSSATTIPSRAMAGNARRKSAMYSWELYSAIRKIAAPAFHAFSNGVTRCRRRHCRSEEHTSELQSRGHLVCRLLLEKKKKLKNITKKLH